MVDANELLLFWRVIGRCWKENYRAGGEMIKSLSFGILYVICKVRKDMVKHNFTILS